MHHYIVGRRLKCKIEEYEYDGSMESVYRDSMLKQFAKTLSDGYFNMIIVDAVNNKVLQHVCIGKVCYYCACSMYM